MLAQSIALTVYAAVTARSHDLPGVFVKLLAGLYSLAGIDAAADGSTLVVQSMQQSHRLAISWDMVFDPATLMFLVGGAAWITIDAGGVNGDLTLNADGSYTYVVHENDAAVQALLHLYQADPADARIGTYAQLLHDQAVLAEGSRLADPSAFAQRINDLIVKTAQ